MLKLVQKVQDMRDATGKNDQGKFLSLKTTFINPDHVAALDEDDKMMSNARKGLFVSELPSGSAFTRIIFSNGNSICVLGDPNELRARLQQEEGRILLKEEK